MIRKFNANEKPLRLSHCPKCDMGSKRLCDINPLSNDTSFVSPFIVFVNTKTRTKICTNPNCDYRIVEKITLGNTEGLK